MLENKDNVKGYLVLKDGRSFEGILFGALESQEDDFVVGEVVFNTSMSGYQEVISDPSYAGQIIVFTTSHIGNVGCNKGDEESQKVFAKGIVVNNLSDIYSNYRGEQSLNKYCIDNNLIGIANVDTRALTRHLRSNHCLPGVIAKSKEKALEQATIAVGTDNCNLAKEVSTKAIYKYGNVDAKYKIAVFDYGVKKSILDNLVAQDMYLTVLPWDQKFHISQQESLENFDGVFLSNGPGDPAAVIGAPETVQQILESGIPLFGICLGHQILSLALGGKTHKLDFGHHGGNHPVLDLKTDKVSITSQNHNYATVEGSSNDFEVTHINANDQTIEGIQAKAYNAFSVQHHPEASPGPHEANELFYRFLELIESSKR